ncbi:MAG: hydroxylamine reductase [Vampirovibrionales bacterium]
MFCYQCEQTAHGSGCTTIGTCGKTADTAILQDVMVYQVKGIGQYAHRARKLGKADRAIDNAVLEALFMTLTNVNFDTDEHVCVIQDLQRTKQQAKALYEQACAEAGQQPEAFDGPAVWQAFPKKEDLFNFGRTLSLEGLKYTMDPDRLSLQELLTYGIKGLAAYAHHAMLLGYTDDSIYAFVHEAMALTTEPDVAIDTLLAACLKAGEVNLTVMALLDQAHTETFGHPEPTHVNTAPVEGKAILVSGHDMKVLHDVLKQTEGTGINVYTHGELLPAHAYPKLKAFKHLVGNYGGAWQLQVREFEAFPGPILMTTNCLKPPSDSYKDRLYTINVMGFDGCPKLSDNDFGPLIEAAKQHAGFPETKPAKTTLIGFGRNAVLGVADKVIDAVKQGAIKHFFLIGGCDGAEFARNYGTGLRAPNPRRHGYPDPGLRQVPTHGSRLRRHRRYPQAA